MDDVVSFTVQYIIGDLRVWVRNSVCCYHLEDRMIVDILLCF